MKRVLVLDGRSRATITIIRSLGKEGFLVDVADEYTAYTAFSKYTHKYYKYPSPLSDSEGFVSWLLDLDIVNLYTAIIPVRDDTTTALVEACERNIFKDKVLVPSAKTFDQARKKANTIRLCRSLKIPHPQSIVSTDFDNDPHILIAEAKKVLELPLIVKPSVSSGSRGIILVQSWEGFADKLISFFKEYDCGLLQEFIPYGGSFGVEFLFYNGTRMAKFTHERLREYPVNGGPSTYRRAASYPEIEGWSENLLTELKWNGVAMVEFRIDKRTKEPKIMEINPRFWGSLAMAYYAGVDFPKLLVDCISKGNCSQNESYNLEMKTRWLLFGDMLWFLAARKKWKDYRSFFSFWDRNLKYDIISLDDPMPILGVFIDLFKTIISKKRLKHIFKRGW